MCARTIRDFGSSHCSRSDCCASCGNASAGSSFAAFREVAQLFLAVPLEAFLLVFSFGAWTAVYRDIEVRPGNTRGVATARPLSVVIGHPDLDKSKEIVAQLGELAQENPFPNLTLSGDNLVGAANFRFTVVPEPGAMTLALVSFAVLLVRKR